MPPESPSPTVKDLVDTIGRALDVLRDDPDFTDPIPPADDAAAWLTEVYTDTRGPLRRRRSLAKGASREGRALAGMLRWHTSGGTLDGLMMARWQAGARADEVDTLAVTTNLLTRGRSSALDAWARTGLVSS